MTVKKLIEILQTADQSLEVGFDDEYGDYTQTSHVIVKRGRVQLGTGYQNEENFWHPGNGNLKCDVKLLGHDWQDE